MWWALWFVYVPAPKTPPPPSSSSTPPPPPPKHHQETTSNTVIMLPRARWQRTKCSPFYIMFACAHGNEKIIKYVCARMATCFSGGGAVGGSEQRANKWNIHAKDVHSSYHDGVLKQSYKYLHGNKSHQSKISWLFT